jgi:hypothetical protein
MPRDAQVIGRRATGWRTGEAGAEDPGEPADPVGVDAAEESAELAPPLATGDPAAPLVSEEAAGVDPRACPGAEDPAPRPAEWAGEGDRASSDAEGDPEAGVGESGG